MPPLYAVCKRNFRVEAEPYDAAAHATGWRVLRCPDNTVEAARLLAARHWGNWLQWPWVATEQA